MATNYMQIRQEIQKHINYLECRFTTYYLMEKIDEKEFIECLQHIYELKQTVKKI